MELLFITLADFAQVVNGKMYVMGAGWDTLNLHAGQAGGAHVAHVPVSLSVGWTELSKEHSLSLELQQAGQRIGQLASAKFNIPKPPGDVYLKHRAFMVVLPVQLPLQAGEYKVKLLVDSREIGAVGYQVAVPMQAFVPSGMPMGRAGSS